MPHRKDHKTRALSRLSSNFVLVTWQTEERAEKNPDSLGSLYCCRCSSEKLRFVECYFCHTSRVKTESQDHNMKHLLPLLCHGGPSLQSEESFGNNSTAVQFCALNQTNKQSKTSHPQKKMTTPKQFTLSISEDSWSTLQGVEYRSPQGDLPQ